MQVNTTGINSYTGRAGNTWYYGSGSATNDAGTRGIAGKGVAFDHGSDGDIDAAAGGFVAAGPNGAVVGGAAAGPNGAVAGRTFTGPNGRGAAVAATNYEMAGIWRGYQSK